MYTIVEYLTSFVVAEALRGLRLALVLVSRMVLSTVLTFLTSILLSSETIHASSS